MAVTEARGSSKVEPAGGARAQEQSPDLPALEACLARQDWEAAYKLAATGLDVWSAGPRIALDTSLRLDMAGEEGLARRLLERLLERGDVQPLFTGPDATRLSLTRELHALDPDFPARVRAELAAGIYEGSLRNAPHLLQYSLTDPVARLARKHMQLRAPTLLATGEWEEDPPDRLGRLWTLFDWGVSWGARILIFLILWSLLMKYTYYN